MGEEVDGMEIFMPISQNEVLVCLLRICRLITEHGEGVTSDDKLNTGKRFNRLQSRFPRILISGDKFNSLTLAPLISPQS